MRDALRTPAALAAALLLAGCASLSEKECRSGDWAAIGRADGERGAPLAELTRHREACAEHGVTPDGARYRQGHAEGLKAYCTPSGGYLAGRRGDAYREACPAGATEAKFLEAFRRGREVSDLVRDVRDLRRSLDDLELAAMSGDYAPEDRTQLRFRADELSQRLRMKEWELERLDRKYAREFGAPELSWQELRG